MPDLGLDDFLRGTLAFVLCFFMLHMVQFLIDYVRVIYPLRQQLEEGDLIAPPVELTFRYHRDVLALAVINFLAIIYAVYQGFPLNPFTVGSIIIWTDLAVTVHRWRPIYQKILQQRVDENAVESGPHQGEEGTNEQEDRGSHIGHHRFRFRVRGSGHGRH